MLTARSRVRPGSGWSPASVTVVHSCSCAIILVWCKEGSWFGASPNPGRGLSEPAYSIIFIETDGDPCKRSLGACGQQRWCGDDGATQGEGDSQLRVPWYEADYDTQLTIHPGDTLVVTHRDDDDSIMIGRRARDNAIIMLDIIIMSAQRHQRCRMPPRGAAQRVDTVDSHVE